MQATTLDQEHVPLAESVLDFFSEQLTLPGRGKRSKGCRVSVQDGEDLRRFGALERDLISRARQGEDVLKALLVLCDPIGVRERTTEPRTNLADGLRELIGKVYGLAESKSDVESALAAILREASGKLPLNLSDDPILVGKHLPKTDSQLLASVRTALGKRSLSSIAFNQTDGTLRFNDGPPHRFAKRKGSLTVSFVDLLRLAEARVQDRGNGWVRRLRKQNSRLTAAQNRNREKKARDLLFSALKRKGLTHLVERSRKDGLRLVALAEISSLVLSRTRPFYRLRPPARVRVTGFGMGAILATAA